MVNGLLVLQISDDGVMTLRNTGASAKLVFKDGDNFTWQIPDQPVAEGRFEQDRLLLKNSQAGVPKWIEHLVFKKADKDVASEVLEIALRQQTAALASFAKVRESSIQRAITNNFRQLSAAADQYFLENGTTKVTLDQLVGPDKFIAKLEAVDGEDYSKLDLNQDANEWKVVTASGIIVTYKR